MGEKDKDLPNTSEDAARGETMPAQGERQERTPREPFERDQSASSQAADNPSMGRMGQLAHDDEESPRQDTSKGVELDQTYERLREGASQPEKQLRR